MSKREQAVADCAATDARHRAAWARQQHEEARLALERRAMLRLELDAPGIDHYDRQALARIARIGAHLLALGLESDPIEDAVGDCEAVLEAKYELEQAESEAQDLRAERDGWEEKYNTLHEAAEDYLDAHPRPQHKTAREALEKIL